MPDKSWKVLERRVATLLGSTRNSLSGSNSKITASDSLHPKFYIECKQSKKLSLNTLYLDTKRKAKKEGKVPVIVQQKTGSPGFLVTIHSNDLYEFCKAYTQQLIKSSVVRPEAIDTMGPDASSRAQDRINRRKK